MKKKFAGNQDGDYSPGREDRWIEGIKLIFELLAEKNSREDFLVLDVGCGDGSFFRFLKMEASIKGVSVKKVKYYGLDSDLSFRRKVEKIGGNFVHGDATNLSTSVKGKKFDIVIASDIIEHIDETDRFIDQIKTAIKQSGRIYLTTPNLAAWHCRLMLLFGYQPLPTEVSNLSSIFGKGMIGKKIYSKGTIHHIRVFTYKALNEFLKYHKLDVVKVIGSGYRRVDTLLFKNQFIGLAPLIIVILKNRSARK